MDRQHLAGRGTSVSVSANTTISPPSRGLLINSTAGGIALINVTMAEDGTVLLLPLVPGVIHPLEVKHVSNVGTTATAAYYFK